jgi:site-specific DNA-methyltransferase (adenine-specific)
MLDEQSGETESIIGSPRGTAKQGLFAHSEFNKVGTEHEDSGGASRFFYIAKASRSEREKGLKGKPKSFLATMGDGIGIREHNDSEPNAHVANFHPTVKPLELMRYLVKLVTPKDGLCLDPFLGSGTTLLACRLEGFNGLGIEKESDYEPIIKERLAYIPPPLDSFGEVSA